MSSYSVQPTCFLLWSFCFFPSGTKFDALEKVELLDICRLQPRKTPADTECNKKPQNQNVFINIGVHVVHVSQYYCVQNVKKQSQKHTVDPLILIHGGIKF